MNEFINIMSKKQEYANTGCKDAVIKGKNMRN